MITETLPKQNHLRMTTATQQHALALYKLEYTSNKMKKWTRHAFGYGLKNGNQRIIPDRL